VCLFKSYARLGKTTTGGWLGLTAGLEDKKQKLDRPARSQSLSRLRYRDYCEDCTEERNFYLNQMENFPSNLFIQSFPFFQQIKSEVKL
jgi:hypothetical protein